MGGVVGSGQDCDGSVGDECAEAITRLAERITGCVSRMENPFLLSTLKRDISSTRGKESVEEQASRKGHAGIKAPCSGSKGAVKGRVF
jgi:hypothetical protein